MTENIETHLTPNPYRNRVTGPETRVVAAKDDTKRRQNLHFKYIDPGAVSHTPGSLKSNGPNESYE